MGFRNRVDRYCRGRSGLRCRITGRSAASVTGLDASLVVREPVRAWSLGVFVRFCVILHVSRGDRRRRIGVACYSEKLGVGNPVCGWNGVVAGCANMPISLSATVWPCDAKLNYNYSRDYDPQTGRHIESDPIGLAGGSYSTYAYALGSPLTVADPSGLCANRKRCEQLREAIDSRDKALASKLGKYDAKGDAEGGFPYFGGLRTSQPGTHYKAIQAMQSNQAKDLAEYESLLCDEDDDQGPGFGVIANDILDRATQPVAPPDWASVPPAPSLPSSNSTTWTAALLALLAAAAAAAAMYVQ
jgi:RHS repeat-associated protein